MKSRLVLFTSLLLLSQTTFGQSCVEIVQHSEYIDYGTYKNGLNNGAAYAITTDKILNEFVLHQKDTLLLYMGFDLYSGMLYEIRYDFEVNKEISASYKWGPIYAKCKFMDYYESGNFKHSGTMIFEESGDWTDYYEDYTSDIKDDYGVAQYSVREDLEFKVYETLLDGLLNGCQVFININTGVLRRLNMYELGNLKAQFSFNEDGSILAIAYDIVNNDLTENYKYKCTLIPFQPDGTMEEEYVLFFDGFPEDGIYTNPDIYDSPQ